MAEKNRYSEAELALEKEGRFDVDIIPYRTDNALNIDGNYDYSFDKPHQKLLRGLLIGVVYLLIRPILFFGCGYRLRGKENIKGVRSGIVVTNHVHHLDCLMIQPLHNYFRIFHTGAWFNAKRDIRGKFLKYLGFYPLNGSYIAQKNLMRRLEEDLKNGCYIHFYPEHAMWPRYKKPRPFKSGAFKYAAKFNVPVIPAFVTFESTPFRKFFHMQDRCVLNVLPPVYPEEGKSDRMNSEKLMAESFKAFVDCYERVYRIPYKLQ